MAGDKKGEDQIKAVSFAAGTAAFMACIGRVVIVSVFVHWRVWAFLALNLLLLAILFTSKSENLSNKIEQENDVYSEFKGKKKRQECIPLVSTNGGEKMVKMHKHEDSVEYETKINEEDDGKKEDHDELSKEELNQRAEAFIAMFRQHLVSDAKGKSYYGLRYQMNSTQSLYSQVGVC
ncbi:hypothetical protein CDL12_27710 [Handroanthus impetiginosus]|uniref:Uncharacterized protein n=1 Tax=Handroanthus impetiginosus TaxID=429701 RepID=A0A2G9G3R7_9LAMI|nr:hypothetical protein CDL12_27710 [Handroanthus impetiginosus]